MYFWEKFIESSLRSKGLVWVMSKVLFNGVEKIYFFVRILRIDCVFKINV